MDSESTLYTLFTHIYTATTPRLFLPRPSFQRLGLTQARAARLSACQSSLAYKTERCCGMIAHYQHLWLSDSASVTALSALGQHSNNSRSAVTYSSDHKCCCDPDGEEMEEQKKKVQIQCEVMRSEAKRVASSGWRGYFGRHATYSITFAVTSKTEFQCLFSFVLPGHAFLHRH